MMGCAEKAAQAFGDMFPIEERPAHGPDEWNATGFHPAAQGALGHSEADCGLGDVQVFVVLIREGDGNAAARVLPQGRAPEQQLQGKFGEIPDMFGRRVIAGPCEDTDSAG